MGRRRLIPWSRLVRADSEKPGFTLGVRFGDGSYPSSDRGDCFNASVESRKSWNPEWIPSSRVVTDPTGHGESLDTSEY